MALRLITAPASQPVTLAEAKAQCRVTNTDSDTKITALIAAATAFVESWTGRAIIEQTWEEVLDDFSDAILLGKGPVQSITSLKYFDTAGVEQTVDSANYTLDAVSDPQWLVKAADYSWPSVNEGVNNVVIRFVAGYTAVPEDLRHAILLLVAHWFDNREGEGKLPDWLAALLANHRSFA